MMLVALGLYSPCSAALCPMLAGCVRKEGRRREGVDDDRCQSVAVSASSTATSTGTKVTDACEREWHRVSYDAYYGAAEADEVEASIPAPGRRWSLRTMEVRTMGRTRRSTNLREIGPQPYPVSLVPYRAPLSGGRRVAVYRASREGESQLAG